MPTKTKRTAAGPAEVSADVLLVEALSRGLKKKGQEKLPAGMHRLRGQAVIEIDCFIQKGGPQPQKIPWPAKTLLAVALRKIVKHETALRELLAQAADEVLAAGDQEAIDLGPVGIALAAVREECAEKIPTQPKEGNTTVTGKIEVLRFEAA
jgi:hypothetical protein